MNNEYIFIPPLYILYPLPLEYQKVMLMFSLCTAIGLHLLKEHNRFVTMYSTTVFLNAFHVHLHDYYAIVCGNSFGSERMVSDSSCVIYLPL